MIDLGPDTDATAALRQLADMHRRAVAAEAEVVELRARVARLEESGALVLLPSDTSPVAELVRAACGIDLEALTDAGADAARDPAVKDWVERGRK